MLTEIVELIKSPLFWFSSVFVGIIVSVISNLFSKYFENALSKLSKKQELKNKAKKKEFEEKIESAIRKVTKVSDLEVHSIYKTIWSFFILFVFLLMIIVCYTVFADNHILQFFTVIFWVVEIYFAMKFVNEISEDRRFIEALRDKYEEIEINNKPAEEN